MLYAVVTFAMSVLKIDMGSLFCFWTAARSVLTYGNERSIELRGALRVKWPRLPSSGDGRWGVFASRLLPSRDCILPLRLLALMDDSESQTRFTALVSGTAAEHLEIGRAHV